MLLKSALTFAEMGMFKCSNIMEIIGGVSNSDILLMGACLLCMSMKMYTESKRGKI